MTDTIHVLLEKTLTMLGLMLIALNIAGWMKKREFKYFGETTMYISVGLATSLVFRVIYAIFGSEPILKDVQLSTNFFYMVLLPPIIFEGGFSVHRTLFFRNLSTILGLAFAGGIFSTVAIAVVMYLGTSFMDTPLSIIESLIFGSLISSTDPVTILAMLPEETDRRLYMMIFGESALNDAVAIILYRFFSELADPQYHLSAGQFFLSLLESAWVFLGSFITGIMTAFIFAKLTKHQRLTHEAEVYEVIMMLVFGYSSYLLGEALKLSGIVSVFFTGIAMAHYAKPNMTSESLLVAKHMLRVFSTICDCFIFMYLGMGLLAFPNAQYVPYVIFVALVGIAVGRLHVFVVCGFQNLVDRTSRIPLAHQLFVWFSGLRGAVAFALAVGLLENPDLSQYARSTIFGTAIIVIVTTVYGLNLMTPIMIDKLGIATPAAAPKAEGATAEAIQQGGTGAGAHNTHDDETDDGVAPLADEEMRGALGWLYRMDKKYLSPFLSNTSRERDDRQVAGEYTKVVDGLHLHDLTGGSEMVMLTTVRPKADGQPSQANSSVGKERAVPYTGQDIRSVPSVGSAEKEKS